MMRYLMWIAEVLCGATVKMCDILICSLVIWLLVGCKQVADTSEWNGLPAKHVCSSPYHTDEPAVCIADGRVYQCVPDGHGSMTCSQFVAEIKCTNIVNVETVCPEAKGSGGR